MLLSRHRLLIGISLLCLGSLAWPGEAMAESHLASVSNLGAAALDRVQAHEPSIPGPYAAFDLGLDGPRSSGKDQDADVGSGAPITPGSEFRPEPARDSAPPGPVTVSPYVVPDRPEVRYFIDRFQTGYRRAVVERWLVRSGRYLGRIREIFAERGLPEDLVFTAMIESGFDPVAVSRAGAKGLWQFMAPTARRYGLRVDRWVDERLDPEKSTWAAASYLKDLFAMFDSWHLAQAAYNAGEMRIIRAIRSVRSRDFWQLSRTPFLTEETKAFVAAIQAATLIGREPDRYGFTVTPEDPLRYEMIKVPPSVPLPRLAAMSGIAAGELQRLNPELRQAQTPPGAQYALKVPMGGAVAMKVAFQREAAAALAAVARRDPARRLARASLPRPPDRGIHVVQSQETVGGIAKRYGVSSAEIVRWNQLADAGRIFPGDRLRVALAAPADREEGQGGFR